MGILGYQWYIDFYNALQRYFFESKYKQMSTCLSWLFFYVWRSNFWLHVAFSRQFSMKYNSEHTNCKEILMSPEKCLGFCSCCIWARIWQKVPSAINILTCVIRSPSSEFVSSSILSWQILTAQAQPFRGARDLAFWQKVPLDSLLVWASSGCGCAGSPEPSLLA